MPASITAAAQAEAPAESLRRAGEPTTTGLARIVTSVQRTAAVAAGLLCRALHNRRVDRRQPLKKLALQLYRVEHERLRFWQLGGEPLRTTLNKFSEGLRLSAPRQT
jgi:hypothetical protein